MTPLRLYVPLAVGLFWSQAATQCPDGEACAPEADELSSMLQSKQRHEQPADAQRDAEWARSPNAFCRPGDNVRCPGSNEICAGNECCPPTKQSGGRTFPCPSAKNTFAGCQSKAKVWDCSEGKAYKLRDIYKSFNSTGDPEDPMSHGGILLHMIDTRVVTSELVNLTDCAKNHRRTCGSWSFLRRDFPPVAFNMPGKYMKRVGLVLKPELVWPIVTGMAPIDSNTNQRTVCSNEMGRDYEIPTDGDLFQCMRSAALKEGISPTSTFVQPAAGTGQQGVRKKCKPRDYRCMFVNSGGCMTVPEFGSWPSCEFDRSPNSPSYLNFQQCFSFSKVNESYTEVFFRNSCKPCSSPYYCVPEQAPQGWFINPNYDPEREEFRAYVGPDGSGLVDLFFEPFVSGPSFPRSTTNKMCKWRRQDWDAWAQSSKRVYRKILEAAGEVAEPGANLPPGLGRGYLWALPGTFIYLENEVNLYTSPFTEGRRYQLQNQLFQEAIMGVFIDRRTCEQQLAPLNGVEAVLPNGTVLSSAADRCRAYGVDTALEQQLIASDTEVAIKLQAMLPGTVLLDATLASTAFPDSTTWKLAFKGKVDPATVFKKFQP